MLRKIRLAAALLFFTMITLLFLDFTGTVHGWFGWMAKIQFLPAVLALNVGVVIALVLLTLLLGRVYCSVICPLGVFQDIISWVSGKVKKNRFRYSPALSWLRYGVLAVFVVALVAGAVSLAALIAPYSAYGRIVSNLLTPLYQWGNNVLALWAERVDSYAFYSVDVWMKGLSTFAVAVGTVIVLFILAWRGEELIAIPFARWVQYWDSYLDILILNRLLIRLNVMVADFVLVIASLPALIPKHMRLIIPVVLLVWIV